MIGQERRRYVRHETRATVELTVHGQRHRCETEDLGAGGCRVVLPFEVQKGEPVEVRLTAAGAVADGRAAVAWANHGTPCRAGLCFSDALAEQVIAVIRALLGTVPIETEEPVA